MADLLLKTMTQKGRQAQPPVRVGRLRRVRQLWRRPSWVPRESVRLSLRSARPRRQEWIMI